jgi:hypothetical protein
MQFGIWHLASDMTGSRVTDLRLVWKDCEPKYLSLIVRALTIQPHFLSISCSSVAQMNLSRSELPWSSLQALSMLDTPSPAVQDVP